MTITHISNARYIRPDNSIIDMMVFPPCSIGAFDFANSPDDPASAAKQIKAPIEQGGNTIAPYVPPAIVKPVPQSITRRQLLLALLGAIGGIPVHAVAASGSATVRAASDAFFGINFVGFQYVKTTNYYCYPTDDDWSFFQSKGIKLVRFPIAWERLQPVLNGPLDTTDLNDIKAAMAAAAHYGINLIIDLHNNGFWSSDYPTYGAPGHSTGYALGSANLTQDMFVDFWTKLATALDGLPGLGGYDLMNEPNGLANIFVWPEFAQAAVTAIRAVDATTPIHVGGYHSSSAKNWLRDNYNLHLKVQGTNVIFDAHQYFDANGSGYYAQTYDAQGATPTTGVDDLTPYLSWVSAMGVKGFLGEFGVPKDDARWGPVLANALAAANSAGVSGSAWFYGTASSELTEKINLNPKANSGNEHPSMPALVFFKQGLVSDAPAKVAFFDRLASPPTGEQADLYNAIFAAIANNNIALDVLWIMGGGLSQADSRVNLISAPVPAMDTTWTLTEVAAPTFTQGRGYTGNGTSSYLRTGFIPAVHGIAYQQNSCAYGYWSLTAGGATPVMNMGGGGGWGYTNFYNSGANIMSVRCNATTGVNVATGSHTDGFFIALRSDANNVTIYRNGVALGSAANNATAHASNAEMYLLAGNNYGSMALPSSHQLACAFMGGYMTQTQVTALKDAIGALLVYAGE